MEEITGLIPSYPGCGNAKSSVRLASGIFEAGQSSSRGRLRRLRQPVRSWRRELSSALLTGRFAGFCAALGLSGMWHKGSVYKVHTLGFGLGRTGAGSGRIPYVSGGGQCLRGLECSSSPTSGTCFPCSGACGPLNVYKSPFMGPCGAHFVGGGWSGGSFSWLGQRCGCVLLHGRERLELHDFL